MGATRLHGVTGIEPPSRPAGYPGRCILFHSTDSNSARPAGSGESLSAEERELLLDIAQMALDIAGLFEPTPVADSVNAVVSAVRGDWLGTGISVAGIVPYVGDAAKAGKYSRYMAAIDKAMRKAKQNPRFATLANGALRQLGRLLNSIPVQAMPAELRIQLLNLRNRLDLHFQPLVGFANRLSQEQILQYGRWWARYIDALPLPPPARDKGVLWSQITELGARKLVRHRDAGEQTLEMLLQKHTDFFEQYERWVKPLKAKYGDQVWNLIERPIWERVSKKYVRSLAGSVTAFVDRAKFTARQADSLTKVAREGEKNVGAVLGEELMEIIEMMMKENANVNLVVLKDVNGSGWASNLTRSDVLKYPRKARSENH